MSIQTIDWTYRSQAHLLRRKRTRAQSRAKWEVRMKRWVSLMLAGTILASPALGQELRLGFLSTTTGNGAAIGTHQVNRWKLGLEHEGWIKDGDKLGDVPTRVFYADDQQRPDTAITEVERLLKQDKVHIV